MSSDLNQPNIDRVRRAYDSVKAQLGKIQEIQSLPPNEAVHMYNLSNVLAKIHYALQRSYSDEEAMLMISYLESTGMQIATTITALPGVICVN